MTNSLAPGDALLVLLAVLIAVSTATLAPAALPPMMMKRVPFSQIVSSGEA